MRLSRDAGVFPVGIKNTISEKELKENGVQKIISSISCLIDLIT